MRALSCLLLVFAGACTARLAEPTPVTPTPAEPPPPVPVPLPGGSGCVESRELKAFVLALEAERQRARSAALATTLAPLGAQAVEHPTLFQDGLPELRVGQTYEHDGQRYGVVAQLATTIPPRVPLVQQGNTQHPLDERPRAHPVPLLVCGGPACPSTSAPSLPPRRFIAVPFAATWELGPPLPLSYDFWWAQVRYDRARDCPETARPRQ